MRRDRQGLPVSPNENAVACAVVTPINAMLPGHALELRNLPIQLVSPHCVQQFSGGISVLNDTANGITFLWATHHMLNQIAQLVAPSNSAQRLGNVHAVLG